MIGGFLYASAQETYDRLPRGVSSAMLSAMSLVELV
jgi:hypothetical protein